ncbi:MAG: YigZ family protein [Clostridiales bacterium]|nr:YigZ family protein [Clostridiales bacterium]
MNSYKTFLKDFATDSFIEKKSEFISYAKRIYDEDEAKAFIAEIRKKHSDASHNCYAYILKDSGIARFSDDGEPGGTAGMPILEVLKREGLSGVCIVVTRYFGGILLGAGGLVRAYAKGAKLGVDASGVVEFVPYVVFFVSLSYSDYEKIQKEASKYGVSITDTAFEENVKITMSAKAENYELFSSFISDYTGGKCVCEISGETYGPA